MTADTDPGPLRAVNGDRGIPTDPGTVTPLEIFVTRKLGLVLGAMVSRKSVVVSRGMTRQLVANAGP